MDGNSSLSSLFSQGVAPLETPAWHWHCSKLFRTFDSVNLQDSWTDQLETLQHFEANNHFDHGTLLSQSTAQADSFQAG
eukprot:3288445-Pyramimonas_sp.AAC.1